MIAVTEADGSEMQAQQAEVQVMTVARDDVYFKESAEISELNVAATETKVEDANEEIAKNASHESTYLSDDKPYTSEYIETVAKPSAAVAVTRAQSKSTFDDASASANIVQEGVFVTPQIKKKLDNVDEHGRVISSAIYDESIKVNWIRARKSFFQHDYALSEKLYQHVIDHTESNYNALGELGNVFFNQGKYTQAAAAYYKAAVILVKNGQTGRAISLVGVLRSLDKVKAAALQKIIEESLS